MTWLICFVHIIKKKIFVAERHLETLYILVGQVGKKSLSHLDNEKLFYF